MHIVGQGKLGIRGILRLRGRNLTEGVYGLHLAHIVELGEGHAPVTSLDGFGLLAACKEGGAASEAQQAK